MQKEIKAIAYSLFLSLENKTDKEQEKIFDNLVSYLKKKKKDYLLESIFKQFLNFYLKRKKVEIFLARNFQDKKFLEQVESFARKEFPEREIFKIETRKELIGGFVMRDENYQIKASINDFLLQFKK